MILHRQNKEIEYTIFFPKAGYAFSSSGAMLLLAFMKLVTAFIYVAVVLSIAGSAISGGLYYWAGDIQKAEADIMGGVSAVVGPCVLYAIMSSVLSPT
jgi:hypothetical protein